MIGGLQYLTHTRPDIANVVEIVARFQVNPKETHLIAVKKIFRYLKGNIDFGLLYDKNNDFTLKAFTDADWAGCVEDKKSTSGGAFFLGNRLVSWLSKKQDYIAQSTAESEYAVATNNCTKVIWMKQMLKDIGVLFEEPIVIYCDNTSTINMSKNLVMHSKTKHISIKYHFLSDKVVDKEVRLEYVCSKEQIADIFTKPLPKDDFEHLRSLLGVQAPLISH